MLGSSCKTGSCCGNHRTSCYLSISRWQPWLLWSALTGMPSSCTYIGFFCALRMSTTRRLQASEPWLFAPIPFSPCRCHQPMLGVPVRSEHPRLWLGALGTKPFRASCAKFRFLSSFNCTIDSELFWDMDLTSHLGVVRYLNGKQIVIRYKVPRTPTAHIEFTAAKVAVRC